MYFFDRNLHFISLPNFVRKQFKTTLIISDGCKWSNYESSKKHSKIKSSKVCRLVNVADSCLVSSHPIFNQIPFIHCCWKCAQLVFHKWDVNPTVQGWKMDFYGSTVGERRFGLSFFVDSSCISTIFKHARSQHDETRAHVRSTNVSHTTARQYPRAMG